MEEEITDLNMAIDILNGMKSGATFYKFVKLIVEA